MRDIIADEHTARYSPSKQYVVLFLKEYLRRIESVPDYSFDDELLEHFVMLLASTDTLSGVRTGAAHVVSTDFNDAVLQQLEHNKEISKHSHTRGVEGTI
ncbi:hypothetical protein H4R19_002959 [Coemansia spiralis]|nr:hypothetical protein H4R19_002959 [Coemansia spiralis]